MRLATPPALVLIIITACVPLLEPSRDDDGGLTDPPTSTGATFGPSTAPTTDPTDAPTTNPTTAPSDATSSDDGPPPPPDTTTTATGTGEPFPPGPEPLVSEVFTFLAMDLGDADGDGLLDLVTSGTGAPPRVNFYRGGGDGSFAAADAAIVSELASFSAFVLGDITGDGRADVLAQGTGQPPRVTVYAADGSGGFGELSTTELFIFVQLHAVDVDADGHTDLLTGNGDGFPPRVQGWRGGPAGISDSPLFTLDPFKYTALRGGDLDGDGLADIITAGTGAPPRLNVHAGDGLGGFAAAQVIDLYNFSRFDVGDLDGDGRDDVVTDVPGNAWRFQLHRSAPGRWPEPVVLDGFNFVDFQLGDLDGDGHGDIVAQPTGYPPRVEVYLAPL